MTKLPRFLRPFHVQLSRLGRVVPRLVGRGARSVSTRMGAGRGVPSTVVFHTADHLRCENLPGSDYRVVHAAHAVHRMVPEGIPCGHWRFRQLADVAIPETYVATIPDGRVVGRYAAVIAPPNTLLFDVSRYWSVKTPTEHPIFRRLRLEPPRWVEGSAAVLAARGMDNFYSFVLDVLPRLHLVEEADPVEAVDRFVVDSRLPFQRQLLEMVGVPMDRLVQPSTHPHIQADRLVVPSMPAPEGQTPRWVCQFLRSRLAAEPPPPRGRRIYVRRSEERRTRRVTNEAEVLRFLRRFDVEPVRLETLDVSEQVELFRAADVIVAPHGAGLTNLVFCEPGTTVVELFAPTYMNVCFWALSSQLEGVRYTYVVGEGRAPEPGRFLNDVAADITVSIPKLGAALDAALG